MGYGTLKYDSLKSKRQRKLGNTWLKGVKKLEKF
jgi:hypothetical protein